MDQIRDHAARIERQEERSVEAAQRALHRAGIQRNAVFLAVAIVNLVCIGFKDTGIGMSPETIQKLFKPFEGKAPANSPPSKGLGLSISQELVVQQGGEITAGSDGIGLGSEFVVRLPSAETAPEPPALATSSSSTKPAVPIQRLRILLAEDHVDSANAMARILSQFGYEVDIAATSKSVLELYHRREYDLILSDIGLPDGSGIELVQKMKEIKDIPAIALTGFGSEEDILNSQKRGFIQHLTKPLNVQELRAAIDRLATR